MNARIQDARLAARWLGIAALLNLIWEIVHLPLYTLYRDGAPGEIAFSVAHCTVGDVLISAVVYALASAAARSLQWPLANPIPGLSAFLAGGIGYTLFSEWLNVYVRGSWSYAEAMPLLFGIGLSPLLQWMLVPAGTLALVRAAPGAARQ